MECLPLDYVRKTLLKKQVLCDKTEAELKVDFYKNEMEKDAAVHLHLISLKLKGIYI